MLDLSHVLSENSICNVLPCIIERTRGVSLQLKWGYRYHKKKTVQYQTKRLASKQPIGSSIYRRDEKTVCSSVFPNVLPHTHYNFG